MTTTKSKSAVPASLGLPVLGESLASLTGEDTRLPRLTVPQISISYKDEDDTGKAEGEKKGEFIQYDPATKSRIALGKSITVQVLHHRQALSAFSDTEQFFTPEVSMRATELSLFRVTAGADGKKTVRFMAKGAMKKLREDFPNLGYRRILYVLHDGVLKSLVVKGASFGKFIDLTKALGGASSSAQELVLTTEKGKKGTVTYYAIVFTPGEKADMAALKPVMTELSDWFAAHDRLQDEAQKARATEAAVERGDAPAGTVAPSNTVVADVSPEDLAAEELFGKGEKKAVTDEELTAAGLQ